MKQRKQKIIKVGNSAAVIIPSFLLKEGNLKIGDEVIVEAAPKYLAIKSLDSDIQTNMTSEFRDWLEKFTKKNKKLLKKLAKMP